MCLKIFFFLTWTIFKVFIEFLTILFMFFGFKACGILTPQSGIKPTILELEGEISTTGPPGKSLESLI